MSDLDKYLKESREKKVKYNLGKKYNNILSAINKNKVMGLPSIGYNRVTISYHERNNKGEIIGLIVITPSKEWSALNKDLFFYFVAPLGKPFSSSIGYDARLSDIIDYCEPKSFHGMERDLEVAKLKLKIKLSQMGWEIRDVRI